MVSELLWKAPTTEANPLLGAASEPTLKNLANGGRKLSNAINNDSDKKRFINLRVRLRGSSAFGSNAYVSIYIIYSWDGGSTYEDGSDSVTPAKPPFLVVPLAAVSTQQTLFFEKLPIKNFRFKLLFVNDSGVALTNTDNENQVFEYRTSEEGQ